MLSDICDIKEQDNVDNSQKDKEIEENAPLQRKNEEETVEGEAKNDQENRKRKKKFFENLNLNKDEKHKMEEQYYLCDRPPYYFSFVI